MWNRVEVGLPSHRKTRRFKARTGSNTREAVGAIVMLWDAVKLQAPDGNLEGWTAEDVAAVMEYGPEDADRVVGALVEVGYLELTTVGYQVHDWHEHNGQHSKDAERKRNARAKKTDPAPTSPPSPQLVPSRPRTRSRATAPAPLRPDLSADAPGPSADVRGHSATVRNKTDGTDGTDCVATQRATPAEQLEELYTAHQVTQAEREALDLYAGLHATDLQEADIATRAAILEAPDWRAMVGNVRVPAELAEQAEGDPALLRQLLGAAADRAEARELEEPAPVAVEKPPRAQRVHVGETLHILRHLPKDKQHLGLQVTQRLFNAGIQHPALLTAVARHYRDHAANVRNPWAYYSPGGEGFAFMLQRAIENQANEEHELLKRADREWLTRPTSEVRDAS